MMGRQTRGQERLFYEFSLDEVVPQDHLVRRIDAVLDTTWVHRKLAPFYSTLGRPSVDPELMIRMLIVGYCFGIRSERRLCDEVRLHLAYRWFCKLDLDDRVPHHSTFSENRLGRFRESDILRFVFEGVVRACMARGLVKAEGFAVDASVMEADASRYHGVAPDELDWTDEQRQKGAVKEYLAALDETPPDPRRKTPKVISPSDPASARTYDEVAATRTMILRTKQRLDLKPKRLAADMAYGTGRFFRLVGEPADRTTHPGLGQKPTRRRHILAVRLPL